MADTLAQPAVPAAELGAQQPAEPQAAPPAAVEQQQAVALKQEQGAEQPAAEAAAAPAPAPGAAAAAAAPAGTPSQASGQTAAAAAAAGASPTAQASDARMPVRPYLEQTVVPILMQGMMELNRKRPADPIDFLCNYLQQHNPKKQQKTA